jgi:N-acetylglutamate synthase-like GNAT family acetyltransferase
VNLDNFKILKAQQENKEPIQRFLKENKLRPKITIDKNSIYLLIQNGEAIIATMGAEINQKYALLKSAGVSEQWRKKGIAERLFKNLLKELKRNRVEHLYLFSRQAPEFWSKMGFRKCEIQELINVLADTNQVREFIEDDSIWTDVAWYRPIIQNNRFDLHQ